jgi:NhaP-type Na+/H+ or K+/H+ antiporter
MTKDTFPVVVVLSLFVLLGLGDFLSDFAPGWFVVLYAALAPIVVFFIWVFCISRVEANEAKHGREVDW